MNLWVVLIIGALVGMIIGASVFFAPGEPYKVQVFFASTIKESLVSLLTGFSLNANSSWWQGVGIGILYGLAFSLVVFLAEGGFKKSKDAPYLLGGGVVAGAVIGLCIVSFGFIRS
jgi:hypothetical protein